MLLKRHMDIWCKKFDKPRLESMLITTLAVNLYEHEDNTWNALSNIIAGITKFAEKMSDENKECRNFKKWVGALDSDLMKGNIVLDALVASPKEYDPT